MLGFFNDPLAEALLIHGLMTLVGTPAVALIRRRAGLSPWPALVVAVPAVGLTVTLTQLAITPWPTVAPMRAPPPKRHRPDLTPTIEPVQEP